MVYPVEMLRQEGIYHSHLDSEGRRPVSLFLPQAYEPRYPYPLLVFLHGYGEKEMQWIDAVPSLSRRNYICIGLRGMQSVTRKDGEVGYCWGRGRRCDSAIEDYVLTAIRETMRVCHIHSERIFLAGICEGATIAYQLGLSFPEKFAGMIALNGWLPDGPLPMAGLRYGRHLRVFIGHGMANPRVPRQRAEDAYRLLYAAGVHVDLRCYPADHRLHPEMLRDVDRWLIDRCDDQNLV
ncbi:MAG: esterase [Planctomycetota bacterium]